MLELLIAAFSAAVICFLVRAWIALHQWRVEGLRLHRARFFECAERLLKNPDTSDNTLLMLKNMAGAIDDLRHFHVLLKVLTDFDKDAPKPRNSLDRMQPEDLFVAGFHYFLALSYLKGIWGVYLRSKLARVFDPSATNQTARIIERSVASPYSAARA